MIRLGIPPLTRRQYLSNNAALPPLLIHLLSDLARLLLLLGVVVEYGGSVLRARVGPLAVRGRGVVHLVEVFEEGGVGYTCGVVDYLEGFGICTHLPLALLPKATSHPCPSITSND